MTKDEAKELAKICQEDMEFRNPVAHKVMKHQQIRQHDYGFSPGSWWPIDSSPKEVREACEHLVSIGYMIRGRGYQEGQYFIGGKYGYKAYPPI